MTAHLPCNVPRRAPRGAFDLSPSVLLGIPVRVSLARRAPGWGIIAPRGTPPKGASMRGARARRLSGIDDMTAHLRIARPVRDLQAAVARYATGLDLAVLGRFANHEGFDGAMLGAADAGFHLEFTFCRTHAVAPSPTPEDLLVFYVPDREAWQRRCEAMHIAGFREVEPFNPYWGRLGRTYEDPDGYRVVIQRAAWRNEPAPG